MREARIMILDEATSSIESWMNPSEQTCQQICKLPKDEQTDSLIKTALQEHWSKGKVVAVAQSP